MFCHDSATGLRAIIAVHDTTLGPSFGGTRMRAYPSEAAAVADALALARGMTYKNAAAGLNVGGGKGVIIGDAATDKSEALLRAYGRFVHRLGGLFITAADYGTTPADVAHMRAETPYAVAIPEDGPRQGSISQATAIGLMHGTRAAARHAFGTDDLAGMRVAVQGAGAVGTHVVRLLVDAGAQVTVGDVDPERLRPLEALGVKLADDPNRMHELNAEVFCPCAIGGILTTVTAGELGAPVIVGAANNQLASPEAGMALHARGVLYAPDFIVNAGGISYATDRGVDGRPARRGTRPAGADRGHDRHGADHRQAGGHAALRRGRTARRVPAGRRRSGPRAGRSSVRLAARRDADIGLTARCGDARLSVPAGRS